MGTGFVPMGWRDPAPSRGKFEPPKIDESPRRVRVVRRFRAGVPGKMREVDVGEVVSLPAWVASEAVAAGKAAPLGDDAPAEPRRRKR